METNESILQSQCNALGALAEATQKQLTAMENQLTEMSNQSKTAWLQSEYARIQAKAALQTANAIAEQARVMSVAFEVPLQEATTEARQESDGDRKK